LIRRLIAWSYDLTKPRIRKKAQAIN
jgi:hypothetical protein